MGVTEVAGGSVEPYRAGTGSLGLAGSSGLVLDVLYRSTEPSRFEASQRGKGNRVEIKQLRLDAV
jgi:hypothetical protein